MRQSNLSKQSFVGSLDLLPLGVVSSSQQLQDGVLIGPYGNKHHNYSADKPQMFAYNYSHVINISHNNDHTLSRRTLDYSWIFHPYDYSLRSVSVCLLTMMHLEFHLGSCVYDSLLSGWSSAQIAGITLVQRGTSKTSSLIGWLLKKYYWLITYQMTADIHVSYPALSWPCTGPQHPHWRWSFRWLLRFLCWPATRKMWTEEDYPGVDSLCLLF